MKRAAALLALGAAALMLQSVLGSFIPARFCPDLLLLLVVALGLESRPAGGGIFLAALLGYVADLLSGSLLGQHALMRVIAYGAARGGSRHLNLRGPLPLAVFTACLTGFDALAMGLLTAFFGLGAGVDAALLGQIPARAAVNAISAPFAVAAVHAASRLLSEDDGPRRLLRLEPRRPVP